jgi:hypothetical protein
MIGAAFFYILPAALGIATSIGLLRTKEWARISIIVFSVLLILMAAFGVLVFAVMPTPPSPHEDFPASVQEIMRILVPAFAGTLMCIGVWWLAFLVELPFCIVAAVVGGFTLGKITDWEADP